MRVSGMMVTIVAAGLLGQGAAHAAKPKVDPMRLLDAIAECSAIADPAERLRCYDQRAADLKTARAENARLFQRVEEVEREEFKEITTKIATVAQLEPGAWLMVLADHSVWRTNDVVRDPPERGMSIHIYRGALGSFLANIDEGRAVRVRRMR
jgi:hypothetical protein